MVMVAGILSLRAEYATPWAWLPGLEVSHARLQPSFVSYW
jgi:hypothetical protein